MGFFSALFGGGSSLGDLQIRVVEKQLDTVSGYQVQCKGLIPVYTRKTLGFITSIICKDDFGRPTAGQHAITRGKQKVFSQTRCLWQPDQSKHSGLLAEQGGLPTTLGTFDVRLNDHYELTLTCQPIQIED